MDEINTDIENVKEDDSKELFPVQVYNVEARKDGTIKIEIFDSKLLN